MDSTVQLLTIMADFRGFCGVHMGGGGGDGYGNLLDIGAKWRVFMLFNDLKIAFVPILDY